MSIYVKSITLKLPDEELIFDENNINEIFDKLNSVNEQDLVYTDLILNLAENKNEEISEAIETVDFENNTVSLHYDIPKQVVFTQKFQDRIKKEISSIIESVYPESYDVVNISYNEGDKEGNMQINIDIQAKTEKAINTIEYLDNNVKYIVENIVDYYIN